MITAGYNWLSGLRAVILKMAKQLLHSEVNCYSLEDDRMRISFLLVAETKLRPLTENVDKSLPKQFGA